MSLRTTCDLLFGGPGKSPLAKVNLLFERDTLTERDVAKIEDGIDSVRQIAETARPGMAAQLEAVAEQAELFVADGYDENAGPRDTTLYKSAGLEVAHRCGG